MIIPTPPAGYPPTTDSSSWMGGGMPPAAPPSGPAQPEPPRTKRGRRKDKTGAPEGEQVTKKVVNRQFRFALILGAVVLALGSFIALGANTPALYVVRTVAEIPPGALVDPATHLAAYPVQDDADAEAGAITAATADAAMDLAVEFTEGKRSQFPLAEGEQVHKDDFATTWPTLTPLEPTERLMSITATASAAVAGQIRPGDRVDIAATAGDVSGVVFTDIEVVAVTVPEDKLEGVTPPVAGEEEEAAADEASRVGDPVPGLYTVRVKDVDAAKLYSVDATGEIALIYRPVDATAVDPEPQTAKSVICEKRPSAAVCQG